MTHDQDPQSADTIRRRMATIRHEMNDEVDELVQSARTMTDWRHYVKQYPWLCVGAAAAVGFLVVPSRMEIVSPSADELAKLARRNKLVVEANPRPQASNGLVGGVFNLLASAAVRGAISYLGQNVGKFVGSQTAEANTHEEMFP